MMRLTRLIHKVELLDVGTLDPLELAGEETQNLRLIDPLQALDGATLLVQVDDSVSNDVQVSVGINTTRNGQTDGLQLGMMILTGDNVTASGDDAALHGTDAGVDVQSSCQSLSGELSLSQVGQEATCVDEDSVAANGLDDGHTSSQQLVSQVADVLDTVLDVLILNDSRRPMAIASMSRPARPP